MFEFCDFCRQEVLESLSKISKARAWQSYLSGYFRSQLPKFISQQEEFFNNLATSPLSNNQNLTQQDAALSFKSPNSQEHSAWIQQQIEKLSPWRKGPFLYEDIFIDSEWNSHIKWRVIKDYLKQQSHELKDQKLLDVGAGNAYLSYQARLAGARSVLPLEPTVLYFQQYALLNHALKPEYQIPMLVDRLENLPAQLQAFSQVWSFGLLYHQRAPLQHLRQVYQALEPGGLLLLESLAFEHGDQNFAFTPITTYLGMKNIHFIPSWLALEHWLKKIGFQKIDFFHQRELSPQEQRSTQFSPGKSLQDRIDFASQLTQEGYPLAKRVFVAAHK